MTRARIEAYRQAVARCPSEEIIPTVEDCAEEIGASKGEITRGAVTQLVEVAVRRGADRDVVAYAAAEAYENGVKTGGMVECAPTAWVGPVYGERWKERFLANVRSAVIAATMPSWQRSVLHREAYKMGWFSSNFTAADLSWLADLGGNTLSRADKVDTVTKAFAAGRADPAAILKNNQYSARYAARARGNK